MVDRYTGIQNTLFLVDRGYESYNNLAHVQEKGAFICLDVKISIAAEYCLV